MPVSHPPNAPARPTSARGMGVAATPIAFVQAIVLAYHRYGKDPAGALQKAQIAPDLLHDSQARITALQMERISDAAMQELDEKSEKESERVNFLDPQWRVDG